MGRGVSIQALDLHRDIDELANLLVGTALLAKFFLGLQRLRDGDRVGRVAGDQLGNAVDLRIGHFENAPDITQRGARLQRSEGDDLGDLVETVFLLNIADDLFPPVLAEIDIEVRHRDALGVKEALEQKLPAQRVEIGDRQGPCHHRTCAGTPPGAHRNVARLRPLDEVGNDQEIARKAHLADNAKLKRQPFAIGRRGSLAGRLVHPVGEDMPGKPVLQPVLGLTLELVLLAEPRLGFEGRQDRLAHFRHGAAALRDHQRVADSLGNVGEQRRHLFGGFEIMLGRKARPVILGQLAAIADTQKHVMRHDHVAFFKTAVIRGHQRNIGTDRRVQQHRLGAPLGIEAVPLQLDIDTARKRFLERGKTFINQRRLPLGSRRANETPHRPAGKQDQALAVTSERFQPDHRIIAALDLEKGPRIVAAQRLVTGLALRQKHHLAAAP